jgi:hypothetical protein
MEIREELDQTESNEHHNGDPQLLSSQDDHSGALHSIRHRLAVPSSTAADIVAEKLELLETRPRRPYMIRRPRALQYRYHSKVLKAGEEEVGGESYASLPSTESNSATTNYLIQNHKHHLHDVVEKQRERLDLFIDLIWVGIIGNMSNVFSSEAFKPKESNSGSAILLFFIVFLPSWRIWNGVREFLNNYYM